MWSCTYNKIAQNYQQTHIEEYGEIQIKMWLLVEAGWRVTFQISPKILGECNFLWIYNFPQKVKKKKKIIQEKTGVSLYALVRKSLQDVW